MDNLILAHVQARRGKCRYKEVVLVDGDPDKYLGELRDMLIDKTYHTSPYRIMRVYEPKERTIYKLPYYPDRIAHHAIMNVLQPIWDKTFIDDVYSAIPGRGLHAGITRLKKFMRNEHDTRYCLKFDISKFYPSVDHDILLKLIRKKIKCKDTLWLLEEIVRSPGGNKNIPIGNYLSQYFAQIYLTPLDRWIKEDIGMNYYIRYGDDGVILHHDREFLKKLLPEIANFMRDHLALTINPKSRIFPVDSTGIDFLGYRTFRNYSLLRTNAARRFKHKIRYIEQYHSNMCPQTIVSTVMAYMGWIEFCNGHNLARKYVYENEPMQSILKQATDSIKNKHRA